MRPRSIIRFEQVYIAKIVFGMVGTLWGLMALRDRQPELAEALHSGMTVFPLAFGLIAGLAIELVLLHFVVRRRSDIARWIIVLFYGLACLGVLLGLARGTLFSLRSYPATLLNIALSTGCVWYLFQQDAARWFRGKRWPTDPREPF